MMIFMFLLPDLALVLGIHPGSLFALEGLGELLRVGEHANYPEPRRAVGVVQDLAGVRLAVRYLAPLFGHEAPLFLLPEV